MNNNNFKSAAYRGTLLAFLGCTALVGAAYAAESVPAKTSWAVSRVASVSQGSYCTMAQKYADASVMTFARNIRGEYSLALDFQDPKFKSTEKQSITLRPQGGAAQTYSVTPQSDKTVVVGVGKDATLIKKIASTENLAIEIGGDALSYNLKDFSTGQKELGNCIDALQKTNGKDADMASSQKTAMSSPPAVVNRQVAVVSASTEQGGDLSVEGILAAKPMPSSDVSVVATAGESMPVIPVQPVIKEENPVETPSNNADAMEMENLRAENARLTRAISEQRQAFENKQAAANTAALDELRQKLEAEKIENDKLRNQQSAQDKNEDIKKITAELQAAKDNAASLQSENKVLKETLEAQKKTGASQASQVSQASQGLEALKAENATLRNQLQMYQSKQQVASAPVAPMPDPAVASLTKELEQQKQAVASLQSENETLKKQIAGLSTTAKQIADVDNDRLQKEIRDLRLQTQTIAAEKAALQNQINTLQTASGDKQMKMAGGNWDLEQATRRYQESQREIQRLGAQLQSQQAKCTAEKKEIEYMLFDPKIADSSQIAMLNSLEQQIAEKDAKLKQAESDLAVAKKNSAPDKDQKIAQLQKELDIVKADMGTKIQQASAQQDAVIASLKNELAKKDKTIFDAQSKLADVQNQSMAQTKSQSKMQEQNLASMKADLDKKNQQLIEANAKIEQMSQTKTQMQTQATLINTLQMQLSDAQKQLVSAQNVSQAASAKESAQQAQNMAALQMQVQQGNQKISELQNQVASLKVASTQPAAAPVSAPVQNISFSAPKPAPVNFLSLNDFSNILKSAGVSVRGGLQQVSGGDPASYRAYSWKTDSLYGSVEMRAAPSPAAFDTVIGQYLSRAKSRCSGEFAAVPSAVKAANIGQSKSYEIACVNNDASSSASVLFTYGNGVAMTVAHEGRAEAMDIAMDARDRVAGQIR